MLSRAVLENVWHISSVSWIAAESGGKLSDSFQDWKWIAGIHRLWFTIPERCGDYSVSYKCMTKFPQRRELREEFQRQMKRWYRIVYHLFMLFNPFPAVPDVCFEFLQFRIRDTNHFRKTAAVPEILTLRYKAVFPRILPDKCLFLFTDPKRNSDELLCRAYCCFVGFAFFRHVNQAVLYAGYFGFFPERGENCMRAISKTGKKTITGKKSQIRSEKYIQKMYAKKEKTSIQRAIEKRRKNTQK